MCAATAKGRAGTCQASTKIGVLQLSTTHILFRMIALFAYDHHGGSGEQMQESLSEARDSPSAAQLGRFGRMGVLSTTE